MDIRSHPALAPVINRQQNVLLIGMSGIGKSWLSQQLRRFGCWHYVSIDMDIQNHYLKNELNGHPILENDETSMSSPPNEYPTSNSEPEDYFGSLSSLTNYLGMPGNKGKGGLTFTEYVRRQKKHRQAEISAVEALLEIEAKQPIIADMSGSFCEITTPDTRLFADLKKRYNIISLRENDFLASSLVEQYKKEPKPIYFPPDFLAKHWNEYRNSGQIPEQDVDPSKFMLWIYEKLVVGRRIKYAKLSQHCKITIDASDLRGDIP